MRTTYTLDGRRKADLPEPKRVVRINDVPGGHMDAFSPSYQNPRARTSPNTIKMNEELEAKLEAARKERAEVEAPARPRNPVVPGRPLRRRGKVRR